MKILYYEWSEFSRQDMVETLEGFGHLITVFKHRFSDYLNDPVFEQALTDKLASDSFSFIFTFNYFPIISKVAQKYNIPYVCWVHDCPMLVLYAMNVANDCNYIFVFDRAMQQEVIRCGGKHVFHLPLAVNTSRLNQQLGFSVKQTVLRPDAYTDDVSFVGSLYEKNFFSEVSYLPEKLQGYLNGIMSAQKLLWGADIISPLLTDKITDELSQYIKLEPHPDYTYTDKIVFTEMIQKKITADERFTALNLIADYFPLSLYSGSAQSLCPKSDYKGTVSYHTEMPEVFYRSKINLNITLRSITSGIPLRILDILACRGFLLTNYQPELSDYFEPGTDLVCFEDFPDMIHKIDYYLTHEEDRETIAQNGWKKIQNLFSYQTQVSKMLSLLPFVKL